MTDEDALRALIEEVSYQHAGRFAAWWLAECHKIEERISDPAQRWAILVIALRQIVDQSQARGERTDAEPEPPPG